MTNFRERRVLFGVLAYILLFGIICSFYLGSNFRFIDEKDYYTIARNIAFSHQRSLDGVNPSAYHCPGYPFLLAVFLFFGANVVLLRFLNFLALALSVYLLYRILKEEAPGLAGIIGALLVVCYPVLFYTAGMLYPQTIATTLLLGIVYWGIPPHLYPLPAYGGLSALGERDQKNETLPRGRKLVMGRFEGLLILLYFAGAFIHALFCTRIRYRLPFDLLLIMIVAMFLTRGFPLTTSGNDKHYVCT